MENPSKIEEAAAAAVRDDTVGRAMALPDAPPVGQPQTGDVVQPYRPLPPTQLETQIADLLRPHTLDIRQWAEALFEVSEYPEQESDETTLAMLASILMAKSSEEALQSMNLNRAKELCGDEPGGHSPLLIITGARPIRSEYEDGANCYIIVDAYRKVDGTSARFTTGARAVQAAILAHVANGWLPFEAILTIRAQKTRRGFYPLNLEAGG